MQQLDPASKFAVLGMLSLRPGSGYDIKKLVSSSIGYFWNESYGRIYPLLKQLSKDGFIRPVKERSNGNRERQCYAITDKGTQALAGWLLRSPRAEPARSELLLKMFFAGRIPHEVASAHVLDRQQHEERNLASYDLVEKQIKREHAGHPELPYWLSTVSYGRLRSEAIVSWCTETLARFSQLKTSQQKRGKK